tara:strand:- start:813 stop:1022 length:210 start_codon:yes stop_codon:yes gene_type:complete
MRSANFLSAITADERSGLVYDFKAVIRLDELELTGFDSDGISYFDKGLIFRYRRDILIYNIEIDRIASS